MFFFKLIHLCPDKQLWSLSEQNLCTQGPSYWCQSYTNAMKCDTVNYCHLSNWNSAYSNLGDLRSLDSVSMCNSDESVICASYDLIKHCDRLYRCMEHIMYSNWTPCSIRSRSGCAICESILDRWNRTWNMFNIPPQTPLLCDEKCKGIGQKREVVFLQNRFFFN